MSNDFYTVRINTIRGNEIIPFDLYIQVGAKLIHYTRAKDEVEENRLKTLKKHGLKKLYIRPEHEQDYLNYLENGIKSLNNKQVHIDDRGSRANDTLLVSVENAEKNLDTEAGYNDQRKQLEMISQFIGGERHAIKSMLSAAGISPDVHQHSATVSGLCIAVANKVGGFQKDEVTELAYAALLHDIGKTRLKFDYNKPFDQLTSDQQRQYKLHPEDGVNILSGKAFISPRILGLIASHEEYGAGRGYPEKKDVFKMDMSYQILSLSNKFDRFCMEKNLQPFHAVDPFFELYPNDFDESLVTTLASVLT